ncbi:hypothetical protein ACE8EZ_01685 [Pantoea deleyi]|uniref:hypothetical protein n=1 Tax=Pantoea deleyi TaxID=470932 RepID=UPI0035D41E9A
MDIIQKEFELLFNDKIDHITSLRLRFPVHNIVVGLKPAASQRSFLNESLPQAILQRGTCFETDQRFKGVTASGLPDNGHSDCL